MSRMPNLPNMIVAAALALLPLAGMAETRLLMGEEKGCPWCARWHAEVGDAYPRTPEGRAAPLLPHDIAGPLPDGVTLKRGIFFTPTFVLLDDGVEVARIEGYPGEDFFWGLLDRMLDDAGVTVDDDAASQG